MQRARGKVPTRKNPEMIGAGNQSQEPKKDWGANSRKVIERRMEGKPIPNIAERRLQTPQPIHKQIIEKAKTKNIDKDAPGH